MTIYDPFQPPVLPDDAVPGTGPLFEQRQNDLAQQALARHQRAVTARMGGDQVVIVHRWFNYLRPVVESAEDRLAHRKEDLELSESLTRGEANVMHGSAMAWALTKADAAPLELDERGDLLHTAGSVAGAVVDFIGIRSKFDHRVTVAVSDPGMLPACMRDVTELGKGTQRRNLLAESKRADIGTAYRQARVEAVAHAAFQRPGGPPLSARGMSSESVGSLFKEAAAYAFHDLGPEGMELPEVVTWRGPSGRRPVQASHLELEVVASAWAAPDRGRTRIDTAIRLLDAKGLGHYSEGQVKRLRRAAVRAGLLEATGPGRPKAT